LFWSMKYSKGRLHGWHPPHCPSPKCKHHSPLSKGFAFKKSGFYKRLVDGRRVQRFTCKACSVTFSTQTFSTTYWQKRPDLDIKMFMKTVGCMANRQLARDLQVNPGTIDRHLQRMGRHCQLFHARLMQDAKPPKEIVVDGFESFELSQYHPIHHHVAVEKDTDFFLHFTESPLRRKGTMTQAQKAKRKALEKEHGRPDPQAIRKDMQHLLDVVSKGQDSLIVHSDAHPSYLKAIKNVNCQIQHIITPGKNHRNKHNKLWAVNLLDLLIRHNGANHKRETISYSKRRQDSAGRLAIFLVYRNCIKRRREKDRASPTPAMVRGLCDRRLEVEDIFEERIFRDHVELPERWAEYYDRKVQTRALEKNCEHALSYAR